MDKYFFNTTILNFLVNMISQQVNFIKMRLLTFY